MNKKPSARDVMSRPVKKVFAGTPIPDAAAFLLRAGISGALVVDEHQNPVGVFTFHDMAERVQLRLESAVPALDPTKERARETWEHVPIQRGFHFAAFEDEATVRDYMTHGVITVEPEATIQEVALAMADQGVHRVFVSDRGAIEGVITALDIVRWVGAKVRPA